MLLTNDINLLLVLQTAREFAKNYTDRLNETEHNLATVYGLAFDAMWTIAQVLNYTEGMRLNDINQTFESCRELPGELVPLNEFNYSNAFMGCVIKHNFYKVNFTGVSVRKYTFTKMYIHHESISMHMQRHFTYHLYIDTATLVGANK